MNIWGWCDPEDAQDTLIRRKTHRSSRSQSRVAPSPIPTPTPSHDAAHSRRERRPRKEHRVNNRTVHCGNIPRVLPMDANPEDAKITQAILNNMRDQISCPGIQNETWMAYRNFEQKKPSEIKGGVVRIFPNCLPTKGGLDGTATTTTKRHFIEPDKEDLKGWGRRQLMVKDGVPFKQGKAFDVVQAEHRLATQKYVSGIPPMWKGCEARCSRKQTLPNGWRPTIKDGGWAPDEYGHNKHGLGPSRGPGSTLETRGNDTMASGAKSPAHFTVTCNRHVRTDPSV